MTPQPGLFGSYAKAFVFAMVAGFASTACVGLLCLSWIGLAALAGFFGVPAAYADLVAGSAFVAISVTALVLLVAERRP